MQSLCKSNLEEDWLEGDSTKTLRLFDKAEANSYRDDLLISKTICNYLTSKDFKDDSFFMKEVDLIDMFVNQQCFTSNIVSLIRNDFFQ